MDKFIEAIEKNSIKKYLKTNDPSTGDNFPIRYVSYNGNTEVVKLLLSDPRVDPSADDDYAICYASDNGHLEVVKLLLSDPRVDSSACDNYAIRKASEYGHLEVVKLLLSDPRVNPSDDGNLAIRWASINCYLEVVKLLLSDPRVDFNSIKNDEMKQQLLKEERNKLRKDFIFRYLVIEKASPQISFEGKTKSKIPKALIRKIVYEASYQEKISSIKLLALADLIKNDELIGI